MDNNRSAVFEATTNFAFFCPKSATRCQIDSNKISNSLEALYMETRHETRAGTKMQSNFFFENHFGLIHAVCLSLGSTKSGYFFLGHPVDG